MLKYSVSTQLYNFLIGYHSAIHKDPRPNYAMQYTIYNILVSNEL